MKGFGIGAFIGFILGLWLFGGLVVGRLDDCRKANPGYDCDLGWIRGEAW